MNIAFHGRICLEYAANFLVSSVTWRKLIGYPHDHSIHQGCTSEQKFQEINFMASSLETNYFNFFKSRQGGHFDFSSLGIHDKNNLASILVCPERDVNVADS